jgi:hypothetical protein
MKEPTQPAIRNWPFPQELFLGLAPRQQGNENDPPMTQLDSQLAIRNSPFSKGEHP